MPRQENFFVLFEQMGDVVNEVSDLLPEYFDNISESKERYKEIKTLEDKGDELTSIILNKLNATFVTPIDRGDIHNLAVELDNVIDKIEFIADKINLYDVSSIPEPAKILAQQVSEAGAKIKDAFNDLKDLNKLIAHCERLHELEEETDKVSRKAIAELFRSESDPLNLIKWKELYESLEGTLDAAEDVARILEGIVVKNA